MESAAAPIATEVGCEPAFEIALASLMSGISAGYDRDCQARLAEMTAGGQFDNALKALDRLDPEAFGHAVTWPAEQVRDSLLSHRMKPHSEAAFLFSYHRYLRDHLVQIYSSFEGRACSADKARWALRSLARHFVEGRPIVVDMNQEYTFHLPEKVLNTQDSLVAMFKALRRFHHGYPDLYLVEIGKLYAPARSVGVEPTGTGY